MIFPKGRVRHQNLLTSYTDLSALLATLKSEAFSGTIEVEFPGSSGIIFIDSGEVINGEVKIEAESNRVTGSEAVRSLLALSSQKEGILNVYQLLPEQVALVASNIEYEVLFKGLSTDFTRLDRLLLKLKEEKHDGFVEILTNEKHAIGVLFLQEGEPSGMFTTSESGPSVFGRKSIPAFVENAIKEGAIFNVYQSQRKAPQPLTRVQAAGEGAREREPAGLKELIPILQEVISKAERFVDDISRKGKFLTAFRKSLLEKSGEYPFLDPFGGEFDYREGTIQFTGAVGEKEFVKGIGECLRMTVSYLMEDLPKKKMIPLKLKAEIESSLESHRETLKRLGVDPLLPSFLQ